MNAGGRINRNPVIAHCRSYFLSVGIGKEHAGILQRHMAVDAVADDLVADLRIFPALFGLMAA